MIPGRERAPLCGNLGLVAGRWRQAGVKMLHQVLQQRHRRRECHFGLAPKPRMVHNQAQVCGYHRARVVPHCQLN